MRPPTLTTLALTSTLALAQNNNSTTTNNNKNNTAICPNQQFIDRNLHGRINSTGTTPITLPSDDNSDTAPKPWYVSVLLNDTRDSSPEDAIGGIIAWPYLSVPSDVDADACVYSFSSYNKTATDGHCGGVFSDACSAFLVEAARNSSEGSRCGLFSSRATDVARRNEVCGELTGMGINGWDNVGNKTCAIPSLPGVDLPEGYVSKTIGISASPFGNYLNTKWDGYADAAYNLTAMQAMAFAVVSERNIEDGTRVKDVQLVCVTPNNTQPGSRVVEDRTPWSNSAVGLGSRAGSGLCVVVAGVVALLLTL